MFTKAADIRLRRPSAWGLFVLTIALIGIAERVSLWRTYAMSLDSDEALAGLMALDIWDGRYKIFLWGQPYGGTAEVLPVAVFTKVFGASVFGMRAATLVLGLTAALLTWRIATRLMARRSAVMAGLIVWTWPVAFVAWTMHEYLYYAPLMNLGLLAVLATYRNIELGRRRELLLAGFCLGVGFWTSPYIAYFAFFCVLVAVPTWRAMLQRCWIAVGGFVIGASPWIAFNATRGMRSLQTPETIAHSSYGERLSVFFDTGVPVILGVRGWWHASWLRDSKTLAFVVAALILGAIAAGAATAAVRYVRGRGGVRLPADVLALLAWPFLYAMSPMSSTHEVYTPRYWVLIWPFFALVLARVMQRWGPILVITLALSLVATSAIEDQRTRYVDWPDTAALRDVMQHERVDRFYSGYWVAYRVTYETRRKSIGTPAFREAARSPRFDDLVQQDTDPAWVFRRGEDAEQQFRDLLNARKIDYRSLDAGGYVLYLPASPIHRSDVSEGFTVLMG